MYEDRRRTQPPVESLVIAGVTTRRTFVRAMTFAAGAVVAVGQAAVLRRREAAAQDTITLKHWYHQYGEAGTEDAVNRYAEEYTAANPNVEIELNWVTGDYGAALNTALVGGTAPDVFEVGTAPNLDMVTNGQIAPLDDLFTPELIADFNPRELAMNTINGQIYGIKKVVDTGLLYHRTSMLEEAGVQPPTTMDEVIAASQELNSGRTKGLFLGNDAGIGALLHILPWSAGSEFVDPETNQVTFNNERTALAYTKLRDLRGTDTLLLGSPTDWWDPSAFTQGLTAMAWGGLWAMPQISRELGEDFSVGPWPALDANGTPATFIGGWCECVNAKSSQLDAAKAYVKWLWIDNTEVQTDFNLSYGFHVPPRLSVAAGATALQSGPAAEAVTILNDHGQAQPAVWTGPVNTPLNDAVINIVQNNADAAQELANAATKSQAEIDRLVG